MPDDGKRFDLLSSFVLIAIGIAVGYAILIDPFAGIVVAGGVIVLALAVAMPWAAVALLLGFTPFRILWWGEGGISPIEVAYSCTFLLLVACWLVSGVANLVFDGKAKSIKSPLLPPLIVFFAAALFSAFIAVDKGRPFAAWGSHLNLISFYALYFVVAGYLRSLKDLNKIFTTFLIIGTVAAVRGIFYRLFICQRTVVHVLGIPITKIAMATSTGFIIFLMILPFAILVKDRKAKIFYAFTALFFGTQQVIAFVRSRWIGAIAGAVFLFFVLSPMRKKRFLKYSLVILFLILVYVQICSMFPHEHLFFKFPYLVEERFATIFKPSREITALTRFSEWRAVASKIKEHPVIGNGLGNQISYITYDRAKQPFEISSYIHNSYLFFYLNTGILGLLAVLWLLVTFVFYGLRVYRDTKEDYYKAFALGCVTAMVGIAVSSLIGAGLTFPSRTMMIGFLLGAVVVIDKLAEKDRR